MCKRTPLSRAVPVWYNATVELSYVVAHRIEIFLYRQPLERELLEENYPPHTNKAVTGERYCVVRARNAESVQTAPEFGITPATHQQSRDQ